jgi:hypothetical protein
MDGVHHELESGVDEAAGVFGVEVFDEGGGVFDVGKEGRNRFALTVWSAASFHRLSFGKNPLG